MDAAEFDGWQRYYAVEPFGAYRDNLHAGIIASAVINSTAGRRGRSVSPGDFVLRTKAEERDATTRKSLAFLRAVARRVTDAA